MSKENSNDNNKSANEYELSYMVTRKGATEPAFSGKLNDEKRKGKYNCTNCNNLLFLSEDKFNSYSGWPSFIKVADKKSVNEKIDNSHNMLRTEVECLLCKSHLGHVFDDGPKPEGLRYCINSVALNFIYDDC